MRKQPLPHPTNVHRDCIFTWSGKHGCTRVDVHLQHLCACGAWAKNYNVDGAPTRYGRHNNHRTP